MLLLLLLIVTLPGGGLTYSFFNIDRVFDFLVNIGMKPLVEISFMPSLLASGNKTWSHYNANVTPPKQWEQWADLIRAFASHLIDRYGLQEILTWNFEVVITHTRHTPLKTTTILDLGHQHPTVMC